MPPAAHAPAREKEAVAERPKLEMSKKSNALDREKTCPLLLRVFCSTSRHNPMNEYNRGRSHYTVWHLVGRDIL